MLCPRCRVRLNRTTTRGGVLFDCPQCRGRAVGIPLLRRLGAPESVRKLWGDAYNAKPTPAAGAPCPICRRAMAEVGVAASSSTPPLQLDVCTACQFVWFDPQEFEHFPAAAHDAPKPLSDQARQQIAILEARRVGERAQNEPDDAWPDSPWWIPAILGLPVVEDAPRLKSWPWMTFGLAAVLVVVFLLTFQRLEAAIWAYGLIPAQLWRHGGLTLFTNFFLHAGFWHLLGNTYFLLIFGDNVEDDLGRWRYAALLAAATLIGNLSHILGDPHSTVPCIGASGGISGVITYYALRFPHARLGLLWHYWFYFRWIHLPAYAALFFWFLLQLLLVAYQRMGISNVAALAHLGGAAVGVAAWLVWRFGNRDEAAAAEE